MTDLDSPPRHPGNPGNTRGFVGTSLALLWISYLHLALRTMRKQRTYSAVNILGLAVGMACFLLIGRYVQYELSYDVFLPDADRLHRIVQRQPGHDFLGLDIFAVTPPPLAGALESDFSEVEAATTVGPDASLLTAGEGSSFYEGGMRATASFFEVFGYPFIAGNSDQSLLDPHSVVLTSSLSSKLFPKGDALGNSVGFDDGNVYTVTGIIEDPPDNSHLRFGYVASLESEPSYAQNMTIWTNSSWYTYLKLAPGRRPEALQAAMPALLERHAEVEEAVADRREYIVQPFGDIHLKSHVNFELSPNGDIRKIYLFGSIGVIILLLACINYMNLAVARSAGRVREVGLRKAVGAGRGQLVGQFLGESMLFAVISFVGALLIKRLSLPALGRFVERDLSMTWAQTVQIALPLLAVVILVGLVAGSYPSLYVSRIRAASALKGLGGSPLRRSSGRRVLVTVQVAVSLLLMISSLAILKQLRFIEQKDVGYSREHVITTAVRDADLVERLPALRDELLRTPGIRAVSCSSHLPTNIASNTNVTGIDEEGEEQTIRIYRVSVGEGFTDVFDIRIAEGRDFSVAHPADSSESVLINQAAMRSLGWDSIDGKSLRFYGEYLRQVIGVVADFHLHEMHRPIEPLMIVPGTGWTNRISARIAPSDVQETVSSFQKAVSAYTPYPVNVEFLDDVFADMYRNEFRLGQIILIFTALALFIGALGLYGLAAYSAEQRRREIGVRKALGATLSSIVGLMSRELALIVSVAFAVGAPIAHFGVSTWLEAFSYRAAIGPGIFVLALVAVGLVAWLSIAFQALRAAQTNPVNALRSD